MDQLLSTRTLPLWHYVLPVLWGGGLVLEAGRVAGLARATLSAVGLEDWTRLVAVALGTASVAWIAHRVWRVRVAGDALLVGRYGREVRVPLASVRAVHQDRVLGAPGTVTVRLAAGVPGVGDRFSFLPPARFRLGWRETREADELRRLAGAPATGHVPAV